MDKYVSFKQNTKIDILFGYMGVTIPSKKEDFKPIPVSAVHEDGTEEILKDFYIRKPSSQSVKDFEHLVRTKLLDTSFRKINKPSVVEVVISLNVMQSRFFEIDVDNIAKTVLDTLTGYLFEDDSQVIQLICTKDIHPLNVNGFFIAVTELKENRKGILGDLHLFSLEKT